VTGGLAQRRQVRDRSCAAVSSRRTTEWEREGHTPFELIPACSGFAAAHVCRPEDSEPGSFTMVLLRLSTGYENQEGIAGKEVKWYARIMLAL
jgi:hypothetical protein